MGRGKIISGGTGGLYSVELIRDTARLGAQLLTANSLLSDLEAVVIPGLIAARNTAEADMLAASLALDAAIVAWRGGTGTKEEVDLATKNYLERLEIFSAASQTLRLKEMQKSALVKKCSLMEGDTGNPVLNAWCADLTTDLTAGDVVGTIEIPGERQGSVQIQPGYAGAAAYNAGRDGILQPARAGTPANVFDNLAMLPAWQKFRPTYRTGRIVSFNSDWATCTVVLDAAASSAQGLDVNQSAMLYNVPFEYMEYGISAFSPAEIAAKRINYVPVYYPDDPNPYFYHDFEHPETISLAGDRVIVKFVDQNWGKPVVTGFLDHPCWGQIYIQFIREGSGQILGPYDLLWFELIHLTGGIICDIDTGIEYMPSLQFWKIKINKWGSLYPLPLEFDPPILDANLWISDLYPTGSYLFKNIYPEPLYLSWPPDPADRIGYGVYKAVLPVPPP